MKASSLSIVSGLARIGFTGVSSCSTREHLNRGRQSCEVVFQREGHDVETLYWAGSTEEVRELAREIALRGGADAFRIIEFTAS